MSHHENYVTTNRFHVEVDGDTLGAFSECSGISVEIVKDVHHEGGVNDQQRISLGQTKFSDVTLKRGVTDDVVFSAWLSEVFEDKIKRRSVTITTYNQAGDIMKGWSLIGAIPVGWTLPSLEADGNTVAVEELTLAFEGLKIAKKAAAKIEMSHRDGKEYFASSAWQ